jgi:hypothetical protein
MHFKSCFKKRSYYFEGGFLELQGHFRPTLQFQDLSSRNKNSLGPLIFLLIVFRILILDLLSVSIGTITHSTWLNQRQKVQLKK